MAAAVWGPGEGEVLLLDDDIPLASGRVDLLDVAAAARYSTALARAAGTAGDTVVWNDGDSELLLRLGQVRLERGADGIVLVCLSVFCEEAGEIEVVVPFAVSHDARAGLVAATDAVPHGPAAVVNRWGEALVAAAWEALVEVAAG
jgi:hypothetical protein